MCELLPVNPGFGVHAHGFIPVDTRTIHCDLDHFLCSLLCANSDMIIQAKQRNAEETDLEEGM